MLVVRRPLGRAITMTGGITVRVLKMEWTADGGPCVILGIEAPPEIQIDRDGRAPVAAAGSPALSS